MQRRQEKVRVKLENLCRNWSIERTLVPPNETALLDEAYQHGSPSISSSQTGWLGYANYMSDR